MIRSVAYPDNADWRVRGNCRNLRDPDVMTPHPSDWQGIAAAKTVCAGCPVTAACFDAAVRRDERHGIWGGLTPAERGASGTLAGRRGESATLKCRHCNMRRPAHLVVSRRCRACTPAVRVAVAA